MIVNIVQPGAGMNVDPSSLDTKQHRRLHRPGQDAGHGRLPARRSSRTPWSTPSPRARSCRCCCSRCCSASRCTASAAAARWSSTCIEKSSHVLFSIVGIIMKVAPIGAFGAMAFTIGKYGVGSLRLARQADGHVLRDVPVLHLRRARPDRPRPRLLDLEVHQVHQGRAADRARHLVSRSRCCRA